MPSGVMLEIIDNLLVVDFEHLLIIYAVLHERVKVVYFSVSYQMQIEKVS